MINRRTFLGVTARGALLLPFASRLTATERETLYNGIRLPAIWPPRRRVAPGHPILPPYLAEPPSVISIDVGRQLLVDDFLIEQTTLSRSLHQATYHPANPVLTPDKPWEIRDEYAERTGAPPSPTAMVFSDGVFYDSRDRLFKMWYMGGYQANTCYAVSEDGVTWQKPSLDVIAGTNIVLAGHRDSSTVWIDQEASEARRFKMSLWRNYRLDLFSSPDGIHWAEHGVISPCDDRSTFFWNPFRRVWVFSLRANESKTQISGRYRRYWETADFAPADLSKHSPVAWVKADSADFAREGMAAQPELYNLDCAAYESVVLGLFTIWRGESETREKVNDITVGFSRDGFHWHRPDRRTFVGVAETPGSWNWANVQSAGGACLVVGDQLYFYVSGRQGMPGRNVPGICSTGLATLRRDGFASMDWLPDEAPYVRLGPDGARIGTLTTRPVRFSGEHLFVNADLRDGELRAEILDVAGHPIEPFTTARCEPVRGDGTRLRVRWPATLRAAADRPVRVRFTMTKGRLFAFWVSRYATGESLGYVAAGGPGFASRMDHAGSG